MDPSSRNPRAKAELLVVTSSFASPEGSPGRVVSELITVMSRRTPFHFTWAAHASLERKGEPKPLPVLPEITSQSTLPPTLMPMTGWTFYEQTFKRFWPLWNRQSLKDLRGAIFRSDLVWLNGTLYQGAYRTFRLVRKLKRPLMITQHESPVFFLNRRSVFRNTWLRITDRLFTQRMLRAADIVTFTTDAAARYYIGRVKFKTPPRVIPNGIESQIFHPPSADDYRNLRTRFSLREDQPVLLFSGRFDKANGLAVVRHMARLLPKWRFWVTGNGRIAPESWYLPNVQVFRNRSGGHLAELYQAADLLLLPGNDPESPHILQQALACRLPVVCSPDVVSGQGSAVRCLVVPTDAQSAERTAKQWVQKLKAGKDVWPAGSDENVDASSDTSWDWLQVAGHYTELFLALSRGAS